MTPAMLKRLVVGLGTIVTASIVLGLVLFLLMRLWPHRSELPAQLARKDEKQASAAASNVGAAVAARNDDATLHIDLTTKDISDAFRSLPAPVPPPAGGEPHPIPAAPVERLRDRINEGVARANRSAGDAVSAD